MLQSRSSYSKLKSLALSRLGEQTMNQTTRERVTTTYAVDDRVDFVTLRLIELLTIVDQSLPTVERCAVALAERRNNILEAELLHHLREDTLVAGSIGLATLNISIGLEAKAELSILLVTNAYIYILHERAHDGDSLLRGPQLLAEVQVNRNCYTMTLSSLASQLGELSSLVADGGCDATPMEPGSALHDLIEIEILRISLGDRRMSTVVDNL